MKTPIHIKEKAPLLLINKNKKEQKKKASSNITLEANLKLKEFTTISNIL
jgi:hypothetical protein